MSSLKKQPTPPSKQIKIALNGILRNLNCRKLYYIRCIKPNNLKVPHIFEPSLVLRQVRAQRCDAFPILVLVIQSYVLFNFFFKQCICQDN